MQNDRRRKPWNQEMKEKKKNYKKGELERQKRTDWGKHKEKYREKEC